MARASVGRKALGITAAIVVSLCLLSQTAAQSGKHGDGHERMHGIYEHWTPPGNQGTSCCNDADCRPTRARLGDDGIWLAWDGRDWLRIPKDRVLPTDYAGDGRSHLCEKGGYIYCFTPGPVKG